MMTTDRKITKATFRAFIHKHAENLYILNLSDFDAMVDGVRQVDDAVFRKVKPSGQPVSGEHTLGLAGVWLVGQSRDYFTAYEKNGFHGIEVYNSCGNFVIATKM